MARHRFSRFCFSVVLVATLMLGCTPPVPSQPGETQRTPMTSQPSSTAKEGPVTIRFQSFQTGDVVKKWEEQFAEFEQRTGIKVVHEYVPWKQTIEKDLALAAADQLPDVAMVSGNWHRALAIRGLFADLTDVQFEQLDVKDFWPRLLAAYTYDGKVYGLPTDLDLQLVFYNRDLFDQAGVPYPKPGWTWQDYRTLARSLTQGEGAGKVYGCTTPGKALALMYAWSYGGDLIDADKMVAAVDSPIGTQAMSFLNDLLVTDKSAPLPNTEGVGMDNGRIAMGTYGPWAAWYIFRDVQFKWDVVPVPRGDEEAVLAWGSVMGVFNSSRNKDAAIRFMEWFLSPEMQLQRAIDWAWFPPGRAATEMDGFMDQSVMNMEATQKQHVIDSVAHGRAPLVVKEQAKMDSVFADELSLVATGAKTMPEAIAAIKKSWDELLQAK